MDNRYYGARDNKQAGLEVISDDGTGSSPAHSQVLAKPMFPTFVTTTKERSDLDAAETGYYPEYYPQQPKASRRICGLAPAIFWLIVVLVVLLVAGAVGKYSILFAFHSHIDSE